MTKQNYKIHNIYDTKNLACDLAGGAREGDVFALYGDLGTGKTTFCNFFINYFFPNNPVRVLSPTFNIVRTYESQIQDKPYVIAHFDLYRLHSEEELSELDIEEVFDSHITLIEWPQIIEHLLPDNTIYLNFSEIKMMDGDIESGETEIEIRRYQDAK